MRKFADISFGRRLLVVCIAPLAMGLAMPLKAQESGALRALENVPGAPAAPTSADEPETAGEGQRLFGEEFYLEGDEIDLTILEGEVQVLDARGKVILQMEELNIKSVRLEYSADTKMMYAYGTPENKCIVDRGDTVAYCEKFEYNTETGETRFPDQDTTVVMEKMVIRGQLTTTQNQEEGTTQIKIRGNRPSIGTPGYGGNTDTDIFAEYQFPSTARTPAVQPDAASETKKPSTNSGAETNDLLQPIAPPPSGSR